MKNEQYVYIAILGLVAYFLVRKSPKNDLIYYSNDLDESPQVAEPLPNEHQLNDGSNVITNNNNTGNNNSNNTGTSNIQEPAEVIAPIPRPIKTPSIQEAIDNNVNVIYEEDLGGGRGVVNTSDVVTPNYSIGDGNSDMTEANELIRPYLAQIVRDNVNVVYEEDLGGGRGVVNTSDVVTPNYSIGDGGGSLSEEPTSNGGSIIQEPTTNTNTLSGEISTSMPITSEPITEEMINEAISVCGSSFSIPNEDAESSYSNYYFDGKDFYTQSTSPLIKTVAVKISYQAYIEACKRLQNFQSQFEDTPIESNPPTNDNELLN